MDVAMSSLMFSLPEPPEGQEWCGYCAGLYKYAVIVANEKRIKEIQADSKPGVTWVNQVGVPDLPPLMVAVVRSVCLMASNLGTMGLCWSHAPAISPKPASSLVLPDGQLPPGLAMGRG